MGKNQSAYTAEYRQQMVELVRAGRKPAERAKEFEPSANTIRSWVQQAELDAGERGDGVSTAEREELRRLRRENAQLAEEREILKNPPMACALPSGEKLALGEQAPMASAYAR